MSFVFYDTETTGTNTTFDQILQFGAIRTDHELRELDRFEIRCQLLPYVVPSPGAMRVTGVTVEQLTDTALPSHYEMVRTIKAKLEQWSPAVFIGHNSLRFDEPLLRQALYQTLHAPYLTNTNGNCRADSLRSFRRSTSSNQTSCPCRLMWRAIQHSSSTNLHRPTVSIIALHTTRWGMSRRRSICVAS